jgi:hypothetical protein
MDKPTKIIDGVNYPASAFLVAENREEPITWHLRVRNADGSVNHRLMGAAWAALANPNGYRGNKYEGPEAAEALAKLKKLYAAENMDLPSEKEEAIDLELKAGRRMRSEMVEMVKDMEGMLSRLRAWASYEDGEPAAEGDKPAPEKAAEPTKQQDKQAGPAEPPTSEELLKLIEIEKAQLSLLEV